MRAINLYMLTRERDPVVFPLYERHLSEREEVKRSNPHEQASLRSFVSELLRGDGALTVTPEQLDGFYFSYTIRHISKEFDLLKFSGDRKLILNIELKSEPVGEERIREQLVQNRYYLGHLSERICSFTYVSSADQLYTLNAHNYLVRCTMEDVKRVLLDPALREPAAGNIDDWFDAVYYLISPLGTPEKFLNGEYFLTNQQYDFRGRILKRLRAGTRPCLVGIGGSAGTGKTLLLYDVAMVLSRKKKVMILHCGELCEGHRVIDKRLRNVQIRSLAGEAAWTEAHTPVSVPEDCDYLLVDEAGRLESRMFEALLAKIRERRIAGIFCFDTERFRFADADGQRLRELMEQEMDAMYTLSGNIRINRSVTSFGRLLLDKKDTPKSTDFPSVDIRCAEGEEELTELLSWYRARGYVTPQSGAFAVTGMEYDRVLLVLDGRYAYGEDGKLTGGSGEENLANLRVLYDGIARVRERLCLVIKDNDALFAELMRMLNPDEPVRRRQERPVQENRQQEEQADKEGPAG